MELQTVVRVASALLCVALISQVQGEAPDDHQGGCFVHVVHRQVGEKFPGPIGECSWNTCNEDGTVFATSCGTFTVRPESRCHITETDLTVQYPECCPQVICPDQPPTPVTKTLEDLKPAH